MPLKLVVQRKLLARSDRVKCVDLHPSEPWMLASLYNGNIHVWNYEIPLLIKSFEICDLPVRAAKFVPRKNWIITGSDDMQVRVFNYNTLDRVHILEAHSDYIRSIVIHPTQPFVLTSSDDMLIKLWNWEKNWTCTQVFEGHTHYVMQIVINPKDNNTFASASLDRTVKVWQLGSSSANFTLDGHEKGVNCVDYYHGGEKPYLISGADDKLVKIWDYQNKTCIQTLEGHAQNISAVTFHPELPIILTGSEDGTVRLWHANTHRTLDCQLERVWTIACLKGSNSVALGYDEGSIILKLGREEPAMSMDSSGKIIWAKHSELQQANLKAMVDADIKDGERLPLVVKDMGSCEIYPQTISHNPNGRFVVVCGDGEYIIYTAMALRNKSFGSAEEFVWALDSSEYAVRESSTSVKIFKNFKEKKAFKPEYGAEAIFGGHMLGIKSISGLAFYDWETLELVRRIEIQPKNIYWSESGELVSIATDETFYILRYNSEAVVKAKHFKTPILEDGIEQAFDVLGMHMETVKTGLWVGDCFIYTNSLNRLNYYVGGEIVTIAHLDRVMYLLGYIPKDSRLYLGDMRLNVISYLYLGDKELNVVSYSLLLSVLEYQTAVMRGDFETAHSVLPSVPWEQRTRIAHFLEKQGFKSQALVVSTDPDHKFELALQLGDLTVAYGLAKDAMSDDFATPASNEILNAAELQSEWRITSPVWDEAPSTSSGQRGLASPEKHVDQRRVYSMDRDQGENEQKWKQLAELAMTKCEFQLAEECLHHAKDFGGLLLLATSSGNASMVEKLGQCSETAGINNVAFISYFLLGKKEKALNMLVQTGRLPEAAFFARTYLPSQVSTIVKLWKENLKKVNEKASLALADPEEYENLFPGLSSAIKAEQFMKQKQIRQPAASYSHVIPNYEKDPIKDMLETEADGKFIYVPDDDMTGSQNSLSESGADISGFADHFISSFKVSKRVESVPAKQQTNENIVGTDRNTEIPVSKPVKNEAAMSDLNIDEELELDIKNLILDENIENDIYFEEDLLSGD